MSRFVGMNGSELVMAYNEMAASETGQRLEKRPVVKFKDIPTGMCAV